MKKFLFLILTLSLFNTTTIFAYAENKPETLDQSFINNNETFIKSNNGKYGYKIKTWFYNDVPVSTIYFKNFETGEFKELYQTDDSLRITLELVSAYWSKDDILLFTCYDDDTHYIQTYDPKIDTLTNIGKGNEVLYLEDKDLFYYNPYSSYNPNTGETAIISRDEYYKHQALINGTKNYVIYVDDVKAELEKPIENTRNALYVPVSFVENNLGCDVAVTDDTITIKNDTDTIVFTYGSNMYTVNDVMYSFEYQPQFINSTPYVPLRTVCNNLGYGLMTFELSNRICLTSNQPVKRDSLISENKDLIYSQNGEYGYTVTRYGSHADVVYFMNKNTNEFKELYSSGAHFDVYWTDTNKLILSGGNQKSEFVIYDPEKDELTQIVEAYYGRYINGKNIFVWSTTEYRSDATTDEGSSFYARKLITDGKDGVVVGKDKEISYDKYYEYYYYDLPEQYAYHLEVQDAMEAQQKELDAENRSAFMNWIVGVWDSILEFFGF